MNGKTPGQVRNDILVTLGSSPCPAPWGGVPVPKSLSDPGICQQAGQLVLQEHK